jgi:hypothetical protein
MSLPAGIRLDHYEILSAIETGGIGKLDLPQSAHCVYGTASVVERGTSRTRSRRSAALTSSTPVTGGHRFAAAATSRVLRAPTLSAGVGPLKRLKPTK